MALGENLSDAELQPGPLAVARPRQPLRTRSRDGRARGSSTPPTGLRLKVGTTAASGGRGNENLDLVGFDLPRVTTIGAFALIPDKRNDENLAVAQTHLAMIRFHNRVVARLASQGVSGPALFRRRGRSSCATTSG